ncbi:putative Zn-dependent peptidase [Sesbania bispinosa]|nr:putative Zn-dependent peptidase [Sesbania bispinosa]
MPPKADVPRVLVNEKAMRRWLKKAGGDPGAQGSENQPAASNNERRKKLKLDTQGDAQSVKKVANEEQTIVKVIPTTLPQPQPSMNPPTVQKQVGAHMSSGTQAPSSSVPLVIVGIKDFF